MGRLQVRQIIVIRSPVFLGTVRLIRGQGRVKVRRIQGEGRFSSELRFDQKYRKALIICLCVDRTRAHLNVDRQRTAQFSP